MSFDGIGKKALRAGKFVVFVFVCVKSWVLREKSFVKTVLIGEISQVRRAVFELKILLPVFVAMLRPKVFSGVSFNSLIVGRLCFAFRVTTRLENHL